MSLERENLPPVTAVLVNWNGLKWLKSFLHALLATDYSDFQILIVDNASTDESLAWLAQNHPEIHVLQHDRNAGFAEGNNLALPFIKTPFFALVNTDVEVTPGWLRPLVLALLNDPQKAAVQPKIRAQTKKDSFEYAGAAGGFIDQWGYSFCRGRIFEALEVDKGQYDTPLPVFWTSGACMLIRTETVQRIGLFEASFFAHWEEIDWCWRAQNYGYSLGVVPESLVYHVGGGTLAAESPRKLYLNLRNSLFTFVRNAPLGRAIQLVFFRVILDAVLVLRELMRGRWRTFGVVLHAHLDFYAGLPAAIRSRKGRPRRAFLHLPGVSKGSIVHTYFVQRIKRYSELKSGKP